LGGFFSHVGDVCEKAGLVLDASASLLAFQRGFDDKLRSNGMARLHACR
jgi:hypothetical protein